MEVLGMFRGQGYGGYPFQIGIVASCSIIITTLVPDTVSIHVCFAGPVQYAHICSVDLPCGKMPWIIFPLITFISWIRWLTCSTKSVDQQVKGPVCGSSILPCSLYSIPSWLYDFASMSRLSSQTVMTPGLLLKLAVTQNVSMSSMIFSILSMLFWHCY